jgi:hypothetical protein
MNLPFLVTGSAETTSGGLVDGEDARFKFHCFFDARRHGPKGT